MIDKQELIEGNKLIANFMELEIVTTCYGLTYRYADGHFNTVYKPEELQYSKDWNWLMPVVEKINASGCMVTLNMWTEMRTTECKIYNWGIGEDTIECDLEREVESKIEAVWLCVVDWIKWNNEKKNGKGI